MKIKSIKVIKGKNKWSKSKDKLIHMVLDLGEYEQKPSNKIEGFYERIKEYLPSLKSHRCSEGKPGGFLKRIKEGTWMGHIIEHVALELQTLAGYDTGWGRTRGVKGEKGVYNVVFNYEDEDKGKLAAKEAVNVVKDIINDKDPQIDKIVKKLKTKTLKESIRRIIREEINNFGWIDEIKPTLFQYFESDLLEVGDVLTVRGETLNSDGNPVFLDEGKYQIVKLSNSHLDVARTKFLLSSVKFDIETQKKLDVYNQTDLIEEDMDLEVLDHQRNGTMDMNENVLREDNEDDLQWIRDIEPVGVDLMLNKAFYFDPNREDFDDNLYANYYNRLTTHLVHLGFEPIYGTPLETDPNYFDITGLYAYQNQDDGLVFVYTPGDEDENYGEHIKDFAYSESEDFGDNLEVVDAINFVNTYL